MRNQLFRNTGADRFEETSAAARQLAGANYDLQPPSSDVTRSAGSSNDARLPVRGVHVEHWLSGVKVVEFSAVDR